jgi:hypothetical protein
LGSIAGFKTASNLSLRFWMIEQRLKAFWFQPWKCERAGDDERCEEDRSAHIVRSDSIERALESLRLIFRNFRRSFYSWSVREAIKLVMSIVISSSISSGVMVAPCAVVGLPFSPAGSIAKSQEHDIVHSNQDVA